MSVLLNLRGQRRIVDALFLADKAEAAYRGPSQPAGVVDRVNGVLEYLEELDVALMLLLGAQVEVSVLIGYFHHAWLDVVLMVMECVQRLQKFDTVLLGECILPLRPRF